MNPREENNDLTPCDYFYEDIWKTKCMQHLQLI